MEKMRLTLDELNVQSFVTTGTDADARGTVRAHDAPTDQVECPTVDPNWDSCWFTCGGSCDGTCGSCACESADCSADCSADTCFWGCYTMRGWISLC